MLPVQVGPDVLHLIMEYCRFHRAAGRSDKAHTAPPSPLARTATPCVLTPRRSLQERKLFDERFIRLDTRRLCELTSAADALGMKSLVDLTSRALARMIEGKTPEEIRETFHLPDDLTGAWDPAAWRGRARSPLASQTHDVSHRGRETGASTHGYRRPAHSAAESPLCSKAQGAAGP